MKPSMKRIDGNIGPNDINFYVALLKMVRPALVIEIGVASGFSSIVALKAMAPWGGRLASSVTPIILQEVVDALVNEPEQALPVAATSFVGVGATVYDEKKSARKGKAQP